MPYGEEEVKKPQPKEIEETLPQEDPAFPVYIILEPVNRCNLSCIMCPSVRQSRPRGVMDMVLFRKIVDEIKSESPSTVLWPAVMGEALVAGDRFLDMLRYASANAIRVVWNTNGVLLNPSLIEELGRLDLEEIIVGVDAITEQTYDRIRIGGKFQKVVANIKAMLSHRWQRTRVTVQFIVQQANAHEAEAFKNYWLSQGAVVKIRPRLGWGKGVDAPNLSLPQSARTSRCPWLVRTMSIHWDGTVVQCDADWNGLYPVGNVWKETIQAIWQTTLKRGRDRHRNLDFDFEPCSSCGDWQAGLSEFHIPEDRSLPAVQLEMRGARA
jgi:radical SAM protein with 4Fe4S-binding SPASM domain